MSIELVKCPVCGCTVATDATCCPQCGTREYFREIARDRSKREHEIESRHLAKLEMDGQNACLKVRDEIRKKGKLCISSVNLQKDPFIIPDHDFALGIEDIITPCFCGYDYESENVNVVKYAIIPYGKHRLSISIRLHQSDRRLKDHKWHDNMYIDYFNIVPDNNDVVKVSAQFLYYRPWHNSFTGKVKFDFRGYSIKEEQLDYTKLKRGQIAYLSELSDNAIDVSEYQWPLELMY